jgi:hypothetical protein
MNLLFGWPNKCGKKDHGKCGKKDHGKFVEIILEGNITI